MKLSWFSGRICRAVRDELLSQTLDPEATLSPDSEAHVNTCPHCREFSEALPVVDQLGPAWKAPEPPPWLALSTIAFLEPHWRKNEAPISRYETRILWSNGMAMAAGAAGLLVLLLDQTFPTGQSADFSDLLQVGFKIGLVQMAGGVVISVFLLALRARRSRDDKSRKDSGDIGGRNS